MNSVEISTDFCHGDDMVTWCEPFEVIGPVIIRSAAVRIFFDVVRVACRHRQDNGPTTDRISSQHRHLDERCRQLVHLRTTTMTITTRYRPVKVAHCFLETEWLL